MPRTKKPKKVVDDDDDEMEWDDKPVSIPRAPPARKVAPERTLVDLSLTDEDEEDDEEEEEVQQMTTEKRPDASITFLLLTTTHFTLRLTVHADKKGVPAGVLSVLTLVPNITFDWARNRWLVPLSYHDQLHAILSHYHGVNVEPLPPAILRAVSDRCARHSPDSTNGPPSAEETAACLEELRLRIPESLLKALAPFQQQAVQFIMGNGGRALLADEMGLGKTRTSIACAVAYQEDWPVLVVCPSSARHSWQAELHSLLVPNVLHSRDIVVVENASQSLIEAGRRRAYKFVIISYNLVQKMAVKLDAMNFQVIICDECHYLKNSKARRTKALMPRIKNCRRAIMVSGTPALSRPLELYTQLHALAPISWPDEKAFAKRYCRQDRKGGAGKVAGVGSQFKGASNTTELHVMLTGTLMIRRLKRDILVNLPPKERTVVRIAVEDVGKRKELRSLLSQIRAQEEALRQTKGKKRSRKALAPDAAEAGNPPSDDALTLSSSSSSAAAAAPVPTAAAVAAAAEKKAQEEKKSLLLQLFTRSGEAKLPGVVKHVEKFLDEMKRSGQDGKKEGNTGKLLIFAHHRVVMDHLHKYLESRQVGCIRIDGQTSGRERHAKVHQFQTQPSCRVALLAITAAGIAITLTAANHVFFAEMFWTPGSLIQAEDRAHRIGQTSAVSVTYFLAPGTVDDVLWPLIRRKMRLLGEVVEGSGSNDFAYSGKDEGGKAGSSSSSSSSSSSTAEGEEEEEAEGGEDIDVGGMEALAAEMAVESVLQGRAERAASLGDGDGEGEGDAEDDDDVQDVLGIDAVVVDDPEDGEWPDPLGALYISQHAKRADGGDASAEPDGNPKKKARGKAASPRPPASGIVDLTHLKIPPERPRLPEAQRQALSLGAKWIGLKLPDAQAVAEMQPGSRSNDPELVDLSGGSSQQSERRVLGAAEHKAMKEKSKGHLSALQLMDLQMARAGKPKRRGQR